MLVTFMMGFASGLPLLLTISILQAWMKEEGVDLTVVGMMALVGLPYTLKFVWAPLLDRYTLPFLGRRRGWLLVAQIALIISIVCLGLTNPGKNPWLVAFVAFFVTFFSASQDIIVDAYRREDLADEELGLGSSLYVNGYRVGMLLASGGGLIMSDQITFPAVYMMMALCMAPAIITTLLTPEPEVAEAPKSLKEAIKDPIVEYFARQEALWMLLFILCYKIGDTMASTMTIPFYLDIGFTKTQIGAVVKLFGFWATIAGGLVGGILMLRIHISRALWIFGALQAASTACFSILAAIGSSIPLLASVVAFENFSSGMGTSAFVAFMASITNKKFTATQYALLSSLVGVPRVIASAPTGFFAKYLGWEAFFITCVFIAIPGMLLLIKFAPLNKKL